MAQETADGSASALSNGAAADGEAAEGAELGMGLFNEEEDSKWQGPQPTKPSRTQAPQMWGSYGSSARTQQVKKGSGQTLAFCDMNGSLDWHCHWHQIPLLTLMRLVKWLRGIPAQIWSAIWAQPPLVHVLIRLCNS